MQQSEQKPCSTWGKLKIEIPKCVQSLERLKQTLATEVDRLEKLKETIKKNELGKN